MRVADAAHHTPPARETIRGFNALSAAAVLGTVFGGLFLIFFFVAFVPWLLSNAMTAAVEGLMRQAGFDNFRADTVWDWLLVLGVGAVLVAVVVALAVGIILLYNLFSQRTGLGFQVAAPASHTELHGGPARGQLGSGRQPISDMTRKELYEEACEWKIAGRSTMSQATLAKAVARARAAS